MALNQKYDHGDELSLPVIADTDAGVPVICGRLSGHTRTPEGEGGNDDGFASVDLVGCYEDTVTGALKVGQAVYMTGTPDGNGLLAAALTATATSNTLFGTAITAKGSGSGLATVRPARA